MASHAWDPEHIDVTYSLEAVSVWRTSSDSEAESIVFPITDCTPLPSRSLDTDLSIEVKGATSSDADTIIYQAHLINLIDKYPTGRGLSYGDIRMLDGLWRPHFQELLGCDVGDPGHQYMQGASFKPLRLSLVAGLHNRVWPISNCGGD